MSVLEKGSTAVELVKIPGSSADAVLYPELYGLRGSTDAVHGILEKNLRAHNSLDILPLDIGPYPFQDLACVAIESEREVGPDPLTIRAASSGSEIVTRASIELTASESFEEIRERVLAGEDVSLLMDHADIANLPYGAVALVDALYKSDVRPDQIRVALFLSKLLTRSQEANTDPARASLVNMMHYANTVITSYPNSASMRGSSIPPNVIQEGNKYAIKHYRHERESEGSTITVVAGSGQTDKFHDGAFHMGPVTLGTHKRVLQDSHVFPLGFDPNKGHLFIGTVYEASKGEIATTHAAMEEIALGMHEVSGTPRIYHESPDSYAQILEAMALAQR